ncbi:MAG: Glucosamine-6-phosphate deaminase 1 [bacterium ADurb.Bin400]|nr:MAG: Glucosamine-6-phosphate deaminase 1 [bacterium ADurb.Bin400]
MIGNIIVKSNYEEMSHYAASVVAGIIRLKPDCVLGLPTGSTPIGMYKELIRMHQTEGLDFSGVTTFNLDEYVGLGLDLNKPYTKDQSYARFMWEEFFRHVSLRKENALIPDGRAKDLVKECHYYESRIKQAGGIDLQILGIGTDGHIGFNEPSSPFSSRTRVEDLHAQTIADNYEKFFKPAGFAKGQVPKRAVSMGIATVLEAKQIMLLASGQEKSDVVFKALSGPIMEEMPASVLQLFPEKIRIVTDQTAASRMVKYTE